MFLRCFFVNENIFVIVLTCYVVFCKNDLGREIQL